MNIDTIRNPVAHIEAQSRTFDFGLQRVCRFQNCTPFLVAESLAQNENINVMVPQYEPGVRQALRCEYGVARLFKNHAACRKQHHIGSVNEDRPLHTEFLPYKPNIKDDFSR